MTFEQYMIEGDQFAADYDKLRDRARNRYGPAGRGHDLDKHKWGQDWKKAHDPESTVPDRPYQDAEEYEQQKRDWWNSKTPSKKGGSPSGNYQKAFKQLNKPERTYQDMNSLVQGIIRTRRVKDIINKFGEEYNPVDLAGYMSTDVFNQYNLPEKQWRDPKEDPKWLKVVAAGWSPTKPTKPTKPTGPRNIY